MKCKNCGNILGDNATSCFLCGSTNLEKIEYQQDMPSIVMDNQMNNQINNQDNYANEENVQNNYFDENNINKINNSSKNIGIIFVVSSLILSVIFFVLSIITGYKNVYSYFDNYLNYSSNDFKEYMEKNNYQISDVSNTNQNYNRVSKYYIARINNYSVVYLYSEDEEKIAKSYTSVKKSIIDAETIYVKDKIDINTEKFSKYSVNDNNKYMIVAKKGNSMIFSNANIEYKEKIDKVFENLGYEVTEISLSFIIFLSLWLLTMIVFLVVILWKIFVKTGRKGYISLIPFYNFYCLCKIIIGNGWLFLLMFIPLVNLIFSMYLSYKLAKIFGKSTLYAVGTIFLGIILIPLLAFDNSIYLGIKKS